MLRTGTEHPPTQLAAEPNQPHIGSSPRWRAGVTTEMAAAVPSDSRDPQVDDPVVPRRGTRHQTQFTTIRSQKNTN